jgi:dimethylhistidine N-methyltransferase
MMPQNGTASSTADLIRDRETFLKDVLKGLGSIPKSLPSKYFYDERGVELFDRITELDEYYLTRTEISLLSEKGNVIASVLTQGAVLVEYGSGTSVKTRYLLDRAPHLAAYVPVDASPEMLEVGTTSLAKSYPDLEILPVCADYMNGFRLPPQIASRPRKIGYFPGSTIGNLTPDEAATFLSKARALLGDRGGMLIGIDLKKDPAIIEAAYNDGKGVTAEFNLNLLHRINRELGADFRIPDFRHLAIYEPTHGRIEMHLVSQTSQEVRIGIERIPFASGETIRTEYSYKYDLDGFARIAEAGGFAVRRVWTDPDQRFSVQYLEAE